MCHPVPCHAGHLVNGRNHNSLPSSSSSSSSSNSNKIQAKRRRRRTRCCRPMRPRCSSLRLSRRSASACTSTTPSRPKSANLVRPCHSYLLSDLTASPSTLQPARLSAGWHGLRSKSLPQALPPPAPWLRCLALRPACRHRPRQQPRRRPPSPAPPLPALRQPLIALFALAVALLGSARQLCWLALFASVFGLFFCFVVFF